MLKNTPTQSGSQGPTYEIAFQMDPIGELNVAGDSTLCLMQVAQERGHKIWYYHPRDLTYRAGPITAYAYPVHITGDPENYCRLGEARRLDLAQDIDIVMLRQDPPFDMAYLTTTWILEMLEGQTYVSNNPAAVRNAPEKLFVTRFADLMPATIITHSIDVIREFCREVGEVVIKPLYGNGGAAIFHIGEDERNLASLVEYFALTMREPIIAQQFLPQVKDGDKRIILIDGEPVGCFNRVPKSGEIRSNLATGGQAVRSVLTKREEEICARIGPELRAQELLFAGVDIIDGWLTEINVTSPTGLRNLDALEGINSAALLWDAIDKRMG